MLIVYDKTTGEVIDNTGTSSRWPEGPPDEHAYANVPEARRTDAALLRLHDNDQAELVRQLLEHHHHVDLDTGEVVVDAPLPPPEPIANPDDELRDALTAARGRAADAGTVAALRTSLLEVVDLLTGTTGDAAVAATRKPETPTPGA